jgi:uroporphyrin-III C-methyltransferase
MVYGRAGEEILFFRSRGFEPVVVPGLSSAITGPAFVNVAVTQRGAAESFVVCTGVGQGGKEVSIPGYRRGRTTVILMGVARLAAMVAALTVDDSPRRDGDAYPKHLPIAIVERASMADQRVIFARLDTVETAVESVEQRPPGMIVVGWAVLALQGEGHTDLLDPDRRVGDEERVNSWLGPSGWRIEDGLREEWLH